MSKDNQLVAVITGSSRGIGRGIAKVLGERGATVYVTGRTEVSGTQKSPNGDSDLSTSPLYLSGRDM